MFNDERINAECGKIYGKGILISVLVTLLYIACRSAALLIEGTFHSPLTYTEAVILIFGIAVLLVGFFRFRNSHDERIAYERHSFYTKAGKAFILAVFGTYILTIPFTDEKMLGGQTHNHLLILLEVITYLYLFYSFKAKEINFNYSFIAERGAKYYGRVFLNIGTLCLGLFPAFVLSAAWELVTHEDLGGALAILIAYVSSAAGLSLEYFFISLIEKTSYDSINGQRFALGTRICALVCLVIEFLAALLQGVYVHFVTGNLQDVPGIQNVGTVIALVSRQKLRVDFLLFVLVGLTVSHIMSQVRKGGLTFRLCRIKMLLLALSALEATLTPVWYRALSEDAIRFVALKLNPYLNFVSFALTLTMQILFVYALTKELRVSRIMWAIPASYATVNALGIFLTSQNLLRVSSYVSLAVEIASLAFTVLIIWRYKGFSNDEAQ